MNDTNRLQELMDARGWTQADLADRAGIQQPHISKLIRGKNRPSINTASKVARAFGVSIEDVWPVREEAAS